MTRLMTLACIGVAVCAGIGLIGCGAEQPMVASEPACLATQQFYILDAPVRFTNGIDDYAVKLHGPATPKFNGMKFGMLWNTTRSLIYLEVQEYVVSVPDMQALGGALDLPTPDPKDSVMYWKGVWGYLDMNFREQLMSETFPMDKLSFHEKLLMGAARDWTKYRYRGEDNNVFTF